MSNEFAAALKFILYFAVPRFACPYLGRSFYCFRNFIFFVRVFGLGLDNLFNLRLFDDAGGGWLLDRRWCEISFGSFFVTRRLVFRRKLFRFALF